MKGDAPAGTGSDGFVAPGDAGFSWIRFDRREFSGSLGDIGTDLPLLLAMISAADLDGGSVFIVFGLLQVLMGAVYGLPMPMQPLKAMAVIVITGNIPAAVLAGGGLSIGLMMLVLSLTGLLDWLTRVVGKPVVRGIQVGLGLKLVQLAVGDYAAKDGAAGWVVAGTCFVGMLALRTATRIPAAALVLLGGLAWAFTTGVDWPSLQNSLGWHWPVFQPVTWHDVTTGLVLLALPQLPLSLSNSVIATAQTVGDLFPQRKVSVRQIGLSYAAANLLAPWAGGVPVCHGCGGLAGHYALGGRTGGSALLYGCYYIAAGFLLGDGVDLVVTIFPRPVLGAVLFLEALTLMTLAADTANRQRDFLLMLVVASLAMSAPNGFLVAMGVGVALDAADERWRFLGR